MVRAKFVGDAENPSLKVKEFNAGPGNKVAMSDAQWQEIVSLGKDKLFQDVTNDGVPFPSQKTVGPA